MKLNEVVKSAPLKSYTQFPDKLFLLGPKYHVGGSAGAHTAKSTTKVLFRWSRQPAFLIGICVSYRLLGRHLYVSGNPKNGHLVAK